jgi:hypothetical protein
VHDKYGKYGRYWHIAGGGQNNFQRRKGKKFVFRVDIYCTYIGTGIYYHSWACSPLPACSDIELRPISDLPIWD